MSHRDEADTLAQKRARRDGPRRHPRSTTPAPTSPQAIDEINDETWDRVLELNLSSVMALTRARRAADEEHAAGAGSSTSRRSWASSRRRSATSTRRPSRPCSAWPGPAPSTWATFGITVNCIAPGPFLTDLPMRCCRDAEKKAFADRTALGRWGDPKELVGPALLLASDAGSYITGQTLVVDGGYLAR